MSLLRLVGASAALVVGLLASPVLSAPQVEPVKFERETLDNGLRVIYAPMENAPVVHVRVMYHVGSRDEQPDRQGFAHMFEHMMFRGSKNVASEQHMKLINSFGGICNAFTSFDQTTYVNTIPNNHLETVLWLEADRMASFKVSQPVFETEREVVKEEWRLRYANQPYGPFFQDLFSTAFTTHNYRWTTIGDMDHLAKAQIQELQDFHDKYYIPNNACLIIAGQFDVAQAKEQVRKYFGWIPKGDAFERATKPEPAQSEPRKKVVHRPQVPVARASLAWKGPEYKSEDHVALELFCNIVGGGRSSRAYLDLVSGPDAIAAGAQMGNQQLEDPSLIVASVGVLPGKDADTAVERMKAVIKKAIDEGVTADELEKSKTAIRVALVGQRQTAESVATALGEEEVFGGDANRVNEVLAWLDRATPESVQAVAKKYFRDESLSVVQYLPGTGPAASAPTTKPAAQPNDNPKGGGDTTPSPEATTPSTQPTAVSRRNIQFPEGYPTQPPMDLSPTKASFNKGVVDQVNGVQVITMTDPRLPVVNVSLVMRGGGHAADAKKEGVAGLTASMLTRGVADLTAAQLAEDLESRGISLGADDDGDTTRINCFAMVDQLDHALTRFKQVLQQPTFPADEFAKLQRQSMVGLSQSLSNPGSVADRELDTAVFGDSPLGRNTDILTLRNVKLDDVKAWYATAYRPDNALLVFSGAIEPAKAKELAAKLLEGWATGAPPKATYQFPAIPEKRKIILVDNPAGQQASIRMGILGYDVKDNSRFAGAVATQVLSSGIENRLDRELRAKRGLTYGAGGYFRPTRNGGSFEVTVDTRPNATGEAITAAFEVLEEMRKNDITPEELSYAKTRVAGLMVLQTQTIQQQAGRRVDTVLNDYPVDYYDHYAERIAEIEASQVREVMEKYVQPDRMSIVVVAPAKLVKEQLEKIGDVTVVEMPLARLRHSENP
jgi:zinc protease